MATLSEADLPVVPDFNQDDPCLKSAWAWATAQAKLSWEEVPIVPDFWKLMEVPYSATAHAELSGWLERVRAARFKSLASQRVSKSPSPRQGSQEASNVASLASSRVEGREGAAASSKGVVGVHPSLHQEVGADDEPSTEVSSSVEVAEGGGSPSKDVWDRRGTESLEAVEPSGGGCAWKSSMTVLPPREVDVLGDVLVATNCDKATMADDVATTTTPPGLGREGEGSQPLPLSSRVGGTVRSPYPCLLPDEDEEEPPSPEEPGRAHDSDEDREIEARTVHISETDDEAPLTTLKKDLKRKASPKALGPVRAKPKAVSPKGESREVRMASAVSAGLKQAHAVARKMGMRVEEVDVMEWTASERQQVRTMIVRLFSLLGSSKNLRRLEKDNVTLDAFTQCLCDAYNRAIRKAGPGSWDDEKIPTSRLYRCMQALLSGKVLKDTPEVVWRLPTIGEWYAKGREDRQEELAKWLKPKEKAKAHLSPASTEAPGSSHASGLSSGVVLDKTMPPPRVPSSGLKETKGGGAMRDLGSSRKACFVP